MSDASKTLSYRDDVVLIIRAFDSTESSVLTSGMESREPLMVEYCQYNTVRQITIPNQAAQMVLCNRRVS
jgi:hypothetical protein